MKTEIDVSKQSPESGEQALIEAETASGVARLSLAMAWLAFFLGALAFYSLINGYEKSLVLSVRPRHSGPGFSASTAAYFGGALYGWYLGLAGTFLSLLALCNDHRRSFKAFLAIPAAVYFLAPIVQVIGSSLHVK